MDFHLLISEKYSFHLPDAPEFPNRYSIPLVLV